MLPSIMGCRTRHRRKAERPQEILDAAFEEFATRGFAGTRLDDVAARAGVTKGTIYVYFDGKEDLFIATFKAASLPAFDHLKTLMEAPQRPAADILQEHLMFVAENMMADRRKREVIRILMADGPRFPKLVDRWHAEIVAPVCDAFAAVLAYGVERGEFRKAAASTYPQIILAPIIMANIWLVMFGTQHPLDLRAYFAASIEVFIEGLRVRQDARSPA